MVKLVKPTERERNNKVCSEEEGEHSNNSEKGKENINPDRESGSHRAGCIRRGGGGGDRRWTLKRFRG